MNVVRLFADVAAAGCDRRALVAGLRRKRHALTYGELAGRVDRGVERLRGCGLEPGDRVLLAVPMSIETYVAMLAVLKAGMVVMFVDPAHARATIGHCLRTYPPAAIIATRAAWWARLLVPELRQIPRRVIGLCDRSSPVERQPTAARSSADPALLTFTSGSTGQPKAVVRSHGFLLGQFEVLQAVAEVCADDVDLVTMPMFVLYNLARGICTVLPAGDMRRPGRANPKPLLRQLIDEGATRVIASPALLERLTRHCLRTGTVLGDLRFVATGGGPVPPSLPDRLQSIAPRAKIRIVYGSTEAEPIASIDKDAVSVTDWRRTREGAGLLVGRPVAGCSARVIDSRLCRGRLASCTSAQFDALMLPPGEVGEIVVSGRHVLPGYADRAHNPTSKIEVEGSRWHRTGDAGYFDPAGRLWLVGRMEAAIRDRRGDLYPFQVEYAATSVPGIRRAALIALGGQRVLAVETVGRRVGVGCPMMARCIADWDIDRVERVTRIPVDKRHDAKVDYPALRRALDRRLRRATAVSHRRSVLP